MRAQFTSTNCLILVIEIVMNHRQQSFQFTIDTQTILLDQIVKNY